MPFNDGKVIKMIDVKIWMDKFLLKLDETFGERVRFAGLQGSYGRGEATEKSDIDTVVILDKLSVEKVQRNILRA